GGTFAFVVISGEAGVGKTRLVSEFAERITSRGARVIAGHCLELTAGALPYAPWLQVLRALIDAPKRRRRSTSELTTLAAAAVDVAARAASRYQLFEFCLRALTDAARSQPLAIVLEDLHWADRSSLDLLRFIAANALNTQLLIAATVRTESVSSEVTDVLADLARDSTVERIALAALEREEFDAQARAILGHELPRDTAASIFRRTGGNPFFTEELLATSGDERSGLPADLRELLLLRIG